jgi:hypothetical protein
MSLKLKAFLQLAGILATSLTVAILLNLVTTYVPKETVITLIEFGLIGGLLYMVYTIILSRLEYEERIKSLAQNLEKV